MPLHYNWDGLSGNESDGGSSSEDSEADLCGLNRRSIAARRRSLPFHSSKESLVEANNEGLVLSRKESDDDVEERIIVHLDVDCFYCQCERIDRGIDDSRPFAIGQKHIIVTCNYAAREMGVKKLESKEEALRKCPYLIIYDGSDLERYRKHGRRIYQVFRKACEELAGCPKKVACAKGSMDEMMADVSKVESDSATLSAGGTSIYIYGDSESETTTIREDQTGVSSTYKYRVEDKDDKRDSNQYRSRLVSLASKLVQVRNAILTETGFTTTLGVSNSPLLAKVASSLRKPATVNVLYPSRCTQLLASMPLRSIPGIGSRMMKALVQPLEECYQSKASALSKNSPWTSRDLLKLPLAKVQASLSEVKGMEKSSLAMASLVLDKCRGIDESVVVDDGGGLSKRVSVENSFRRGTMCSEAKVRESMEALYERLPRLLAERIRESPLSYPKTFTMTVRSVDPSLLAQRSQRRPFVTHSSQESIDGQRLLRSAVMSQFLRQIADPILKTLAFERNRSINITRINIALSNFVDPQESRVSAQKLTSRSSPRILRIKQARKSVTVVPSRTNEVPGVDPSFLAALPPELAREVARGQRFHAPRQEKRSAKHLRIDSFFSRKRK